MTRIPIFGILVMCGFKPLGLCNHCDGCGAPFTVAHALSCKKGGLVSNRHNDARDEAGALANHSLQASKITYEPMINNGRGLNDAMQRHATQGSGNQAGKEARGDVLVRGLWETGSSCVLDICITDTDAPSYKDQTSKKVLEGHVKKKKDKYLQACLDRRRTFTPLVYSIDGMACKEARSFI